MDRALAPKYDHSGQKIFDIEPTRLLTLTGAGVAKWYETGDVIKKSMSITVTEVTQLRGARAAIVKGFQVNGNGLIRKNGSERQWLVSEGAFIVWW